MAVTCAEEPTRDTEIPTLMNDFVRDCYSKGNSTYFLEQRDKQQKLFAYEWVYKCFLTKVELLYHF